MDIIDRRTALNQNRTRFYTGRFCKYGHDAERFTSNGGCVECINPKRRGALRSWHQPWMPTAPPLELHDRIHQAGPLAVEAMRKAVQAYIDKVSASWIQEWDAAKASDEG